MDSLAKALAINHYNLSLSTKNTDDSDFDPSEIKWKRIETILKRGITEDDIGFSRNILIIGAGASKNACSEAYTTDQIVEKLYEKLSVFEMIYGTKKELEKDKEKEKEISKIIEQNKKTRPFAEKFFSDAFKHINRVRDDSMKMKTLLDKIGFEGALKILHEFINKEDITKCIVELLNYRYIPNLFYEIIAHMFNHRFIDVIINLNFDEMLDSAIEDEMGDSDWMKITNDASCIKFEKAIVENRLRIPLYIKPHGTISDIDSLLYSVPQYLNLSSSIRDLLKKIFKGTVSHTNELDQGEKKIKRFNIIAVGYAFNDTDVFEHVCENILKNYRHRKKDRFETSLYIFNPHPIEILQNISEKIDHINDYNQYDKFKKELTYYIDHDRLKKLEIKILNEVNDRKKEELKKRYSIQKKQIKKVKKTILKLFVASKDVNSMDNINLKFLSLYKNIRDYFNSPFEPALPLRHLFICKIFTQKYLEGILKTDPTAKGLEQLLQDRYKVNLLFDLLKFNGEVPINVITHGRTGKYYRLYSEEFLDNKNSDKNKLEYIFDLLHHERSGTFKEDSFLVNEEFLKSQKIYESFYGNKETKHLTVNNKEFYEKFAKIIGEIIEEYKNSDVNKIFKDVILECSIHNKIPYTGSHEINSKYDDPEYVKFYPFNSENIINTNLSLTWHFYDYSVNNLKDWNKLIMVSYSGSALINLHIKSSNKENTHLEKIFDKGKTIELYYECEHPVFFEKEDKDEMTPKSIINFIKNDLSKENFTYHNINKIKNFHKMALFLDRDEVKYGIYFFNPPHKNRINPVWFSVVEDDKKKGRDFNKKNLKIMKEYAETLKEKVREQNEINSLKLEIEKLKEQKRN
ncbi:SIR2 family protein [uncultured Kordia sp.]|uniref:SIR2 family protein n=1 Tax=uncultured Kordia sp. TaxID=507699 RepID=UPI00261BC60F|nr:SIR2 family protein [uncultured Kordia sp.]